MKPIRLGFKWPDMHRPDDKCEVCGKRRGRKLNSVIDAPMVRTVVCKPCGGSRKAYELFKAKSAALDASDEYDRYARTRRT